MPEIQKIVLPHGGYRKLIVYRKSDVVYEGTVTFCRRFLPAHGDRTVDQMTQAARGEEFEKGLYSRLAAAESPEALAAKVAELRQKIERAAWSVRRKKGWA